MIWFSSLSPSNWDSCPALGIKALATSSVCPWEEKAVDQWVSGQFPPVGEDQLCHLDSTQQTMTSHW